MGFFSKLIGGITNIGKSILGIGTKAATTTVRVARAAPRAVKVIGGGLAAGGAFAVGERLLSPGEEGYEDQQQALAAAGGNGRFVTATTVQTLDKLTGQVVRQETLKGRPFLMNRDIVIAKRVMRTAGKLGRKFSRKTREPSKMKMLTDSVMDKAIGTVLHSAACPS